MWSVIVCLCFQITLLRYLFMDFLHSYFLHSYFLCLCPWSKRFQNSVTQYIHQEQNPTKTKYLLSETLSSPIPAHSNNHSKVQTVYCKSGTFEDITDHFLDHLLKRLQNNLVGAKMNYDKEYNLLNLEWLKMTPQRMNPQISLAGPSL